MKAYFSKGRENSDTPKKGGFYVNNCGYYRDMDVDMPIVRPSGRSDYHVIFCLRGAMTVESQWLSGGDLYFFPPNRRQTYTYRAVPDSLYYWIHFSGSEAGEIVTRLGLTEGRYRLKARLHDAESVFRMIAHSPSSAEEGRDDVSVGLLYALLALMAEDVRAPTPFYRAIRMLDDLHSEVSVAALAESYHMSREHFIRSFTDAVGIPPYRYRQQRRMEFARMLLSDSSLSIGRIALECGFEDPQYFSRIFKRFVGVSPATYRKNRET